MAFEPVNYATNIAVLDENGFVTNIIWGMIYQLDEYNATYTHVIPIEGYDICPGDQYSDGKWYRNGEELVLRTMEERAEEAEAILDMLYEGTEVTDE